MNKINKQEISAIMIELESQPRDENIKEFNDKLYSNNDHAKELLKHYHWYKSISDMHRKWNWWNWR